MALFGRAKQDFLREFLTLRHGVPSHDPFSRVSRLLDPAPFRRCFPAFMRRCAETRQGVVALDGETPRRSFDRAASASPPHLVSAWAVEQRLALGQLAVDGKSNEITAVPQLLAMLALEGTIVTADAPNCQRAIARRVVDPRAGTTSWRRGATGARCTTTCGCSATTPPRPREAPAASAATTAGSRSGGPRSAPTSAGCRSATAGRGSPPFGKVIARREESGGQVTVRTRHYLLSRAFAPEHFGAIVRAHWDIENGPHWVLDAALDEDRARNRRDHGPENLALLRRPALNLATLEPSEGSMRGRLRRAGWDNRFLARMLARFASPQMR